MEDQIGGFYILYPNRQIEVPYNIFLFENFIMKINMHTHKERHIQLPTWRMIGMFHCYLVIKAVPQRIQNKDMSFILITETMKG